MSKYVKLLFLFVFLITFSSCKKVHTDENNNSIDEVEYPTYTISEYNKMDKYELIRKIDDIEYKYTYFFDSNMCVNAREELKFNLSSEAKKFYEDNKDSETYMDINISNNVVTYLYNPEYFEYLMYPKDVLIELLNLVENDE